MYRLRHKNATQLNLELVLSLGSEPVPITTLRDNQKMCLRKELLGKLAASA